MAWDALATPPAGHGPIAGSAVGAWDGKLVVIGGMDEFFDPVTLVSAYDPGTNSWSTLGNLSTPSYGGTGMAVFSDRAYWSDINGDLRWVDLNTFTEGTVAGYTPSGARPLKVGSRMYFVKTTDFPRSIEAFTHTNTAYDPLPGGFAPNHGVAAAGKVYAVATTEEPPEWSNWDAAGTGDWQALTPMLNSEDAIGYSVGVGLPDGRIALLGEEDLGDSTLIPSLRIYDPLTDSWSVEEAIMAGGFTGGITGAVVDAHLYALVTDYDTSTSYLASLEVGGVGIEAELQIMLTVDAPAIEAELQIQMSVIPPPIEAALTVQMSVIPPVVTDGAWLTIAMSVPAPAVSAQLLVAYNTGGPDVPELEPLVPVITPPPPPVGIPPTPHTPEGATPIVPTREWTASELPQPRSIDGCDEYAFDWRPGGQQAGTVRIYGLDGSPEPEGDFDLETEFDESMEWSVGSASGTTRSYRQPTVELANTTALPELMPLTAMGELPGGIPLDNCLRPVTASLCTGGVDPIISCLASELLQDVLPTRLQLVQQAAAAIDLEFNVLHSFDGLPQHDQAVEVTYRTEGKTFTQVLSDMLLGGGALVWWAPGAVYVNGGGLPEGVFAAPTVLGASGNVNLEVGQAFEDAEPNLSDYLAQCRESDDSDDGCAGETFETANSGTLRWTENAGSGVNYVETRNTLVKAGGQIVREEVEKRAVRTRLVRNVPFGSGLGGAQAVLPVEWQLRENTYLVCCPQALSHSFERIWVAPGGLDENDEWEEGDGTRLASAKEVTQRWHAEGWLASRIEVEWVQHSWRTAWDGTPTPGSAASRLRVIPTFKATKRVERYTPIGGGLWHVHVSITQDIQMPVDDGASQFEVVGSHWGAVVNTWTQVTDQAPPQVTCGRTDPCATGDCETDRTAEFERDHAAWVARRDAWALNHPEGKVVTTVSYPGRLTGYHVGALADEGMVVSVSWAGAGQRTGRPGETTTVEYWGAAT